MDEGRIGFDEEELELEPGQGLTTADETGKIVNRTKGPASMAKEVGF